MKKLFYKPENAWVGDLSLIMRMELIMVFIFMIRD